MGLVFILFTFVFPRFIKIFQAAQVELHLPTRIVIAISTFFRDYGMYLLAFFVLVYVALRLYRRTAAGACGWTRGNSGFHWWAS